MAFAMAVSRPNPDPKFTREALRGEQNARLLASGSSRGVPALESAAAHKSGVNQVALSLHFQSDAESAAAMACLDVHADGVTRKKQKAARALAAGVSLWATSLDVTS